MGFLTASIIILFLAAAISVFPLLIFAEYQKRKLVEKVRTEYGLTLSKSDIQDAATNADNDNLIHRNLVLTHGRKYLFWRLVLLRTLVFAVFSGCVVAVLM